MGKFIDLTGQRFGRLTVLYQDMEKSSKSGRIYWVCRCDCGTVKSISSYGLRSGRTKSCGCLSRELSALSSRTHGDTKTQLYQLWRALKGRCHSKTHRRYQHFGAKGIGMCDEWKDDYSVFKAWCLENDWDESKTVYRIDLNGDFTPENCRVGNRKCVLEHHPKAIYYDYDGEHHTLNNWCKLKNRNVLTVSQRLHYGWTFKRAIETPTPKPYLGDRAECLRLQKQAKLAKEEHKKEHFKEIQEMAVEMISTQ